jgi:hypothetical protein
MTECNCEALAVALERIANDMAANALGHPGMARLAAIARAALSPQPAEAKQCDRSRLRMVFHAYETGVGHGEQGRGVTFKDENWGNPELAFAYRQGVRQGEKGKQPAEAVTQEDLVPGPGGSRVLVCSPHPQDGGNDSDFSPVSAKSLPYLEQPQELQAEPRHCPRCGGTGEVNNSYAVDISDYVPPVYCPQCKGSGVHTSKGNGTSLNQLAGEGKAETLPLMARRKEDEEGGPYVFVHHDGCRVYYRDLCKLSNDVQYGRWFRIADTDEHGLPVIEREPGMPECAKYRHTPPAPLVMEYHEELPCWADTRAVHWQRIEDFFQPQSGQEGRDD